MLKEFIKDRKEVEDLVHNFHNRKLNRLTCNVKVKNFFKIWNKFIIELKQDIFNSKYFSTNIINTKDE